MQSNPTKSSRVTFWNRLPLAQKVLLPVMAGLVILTALFTLINAGNLQRAVADAQLTRFAVIVDSFEDEIDDSASHALALAEAIANQTAAQEALSRNDREAIIQTYLPVYQELSTNYGVRQFQFNSAASRTLVRLHNLEVFNDDLSTYRPTINQVMGSGQPTGGIEIGTSGPGIRGVAPVFYQGQLVGTIEIGLDVGERVQHAQERLGGQWHFILNANSPTVAAIGGLELEAVGPVEGSVNYFSTSGSVVPVSSDTYEQVFASGTSSLQSVSDGSNNYDVSITPVRDFQGNIIGAMQIELVTNEVVDQINQAALGSVATGLLFFLVSAPVVFFIVRGSLSPIRRLTQAAVAIRGGNLDVQVAATTADEVGVLADSFNQMVSELRASFDTLESRVAARTRDLATTIEVGKLATSIYSQQELIPQLVEYIRSKFDLYYTQIYLLDDAKRHAILRSGTGEVGQQLLARGHRLDMSQTSLVARAVQTKLPVLVSDTTASRDHRPNPLLPNTRSEVTIPLIVGGDTLGVLDMQAEKAGTFNAENVTVFEAMAGQIAAILRGTKAYDEAVEATERAETINRRLAGEDWTSYLGRLQQDGHVGYEYDLETVTNLSDELDNTTGEKQVSRSHVVQPITLRGQRIGSIVVKETDEERVLADEQLALIEDISERIAQSLERFRAVDETQVARAEAETLYNVSSRLNDARTPDDVVAAVLSYLEAQDVASINMMYVDSDAQGQPEWVEIKGTYNRDPATAIPVGARFYVPEFAFARLWTSNPDTPTLTGDAFASPLVDENTRQVMAQSGLRALAIIPLYVQGRWIGIISATWTKPVEFTSRDERVLTTLGQQATSVVDALRSFEQTAEAQQEAEALYLLSSLINEAQNEQQLVEASVQYALHPDANVVSLMLWDNYNSQNASNLNIAGEWRNDGQPTLMGVSLPVAGFPSVANLDRNDVSWCNDIASDASIDPMSKDTYQALGFKAYIITPLTVGDRWIGNLGVFSTQPRTHATHEIRILRGISKQLATAAEQMRLNRQIIKRASELETVAQVSAATTTILDPDGLLQSVVDLTKDRFQLYHAHVYLVDEEGDTLVLAAGAGEPGRIMKEQGRRIAINRVNSLVARAARERDSVISNDVTQEADFLPNPLLPETRAELALPMIVADRLIGVLDVQADQTNVFTAGDAQVLGTLADQTAVAIENARAFKEQQQTAERLREVDRMKSQFLANMSHELRTPLNSIIGYAEVLLDGIDGDLTDEAVEDVQAIHGGGRHLLTIINDILDLAKIEAGQMFIDRREADVRPVMEDVINTVSILAKNKGIGIEVTQDEQVPMVYGDPIRIKQIVLNLVNNAIKFTEEGQVKVEIGSRDNNLVVRVIDTGIGMTQQEMGGLFQQFHQVDGSPTRRAGGTGLGLVITRHLVHMHEGDIFVESEKGKGSIFWFTLPLFVGQQVQKV